MIHATIRMVIPSSKRAEAMRILISVVRRTRIAPGCLCCHMYQEVEDRNVVMIDELWQSIEDLECHLRSKDYLRLLLVVEMAKKMPEIRFDAINQSNGVEIIEKARNPLTDMQNTNFPVFR